MIVMVMMVNCICEIIYWKNYQPSSQLGILPEVLLGSVIGFELAQNRHSDIAEWKFEYQITTV